MKDVLGAFSHAKTRPDLVNKRARRVFAQIVRTDRIDVYALARECKLTSGQIREDIAILTAAGLIKRPFVIAEQAA